jgi:hypothetical protein
MSALSTYAASYVGMVNQGNDLVVGTTLEVAICFAEVDIE